MSSHELRTKVAKLESINDLLQTELDHIDSLMKAIGFKHGLATVKAAADEIILKGLHHHNP